MSKILMPSEVMRPRIVSLADLKATLLPLCFGYAWAEGAIVDLWKKGAPVPQSRPNEVERRILIPEHFATWWGEVQQRMGVEASAATVHKLVTSDPTKFRSHAGLPSRR